MLPNANHPIWEIIRLAVPLCCALSALGFMLVFNYNGVDYRDINTLLVVAICGAVATVVARSTK